MLLPSPKRYGQSFRAGKLTDYARETIDNILGKMTQARYLTVEERESEGARSLSFEKGEEKIITDEPLKPDDPANSAL